MAIPSKYERYVRDSNYTVEKDSAGNIVKISKKPEKYIISADVQGKKYENMNVGTYTPYEVQFNAQGNLVSETKYRTVKTVDTKNRVESKVIAQDTRTYGQENKVINREVYDIGKTSSGSQTEVLAYTTTEGTSEGYEIKDAKLANNK